MDDMELGDHETDRALSDGEIRWVARRQLAGSLVVACIIAAIAGLIAVRPTHVDTADRSTTRIAGVRQPSLAVEPGHELAGVVQHPNQLP